MKKLLFLCLVLIMLGFSKCEKCKSCTMVTDCTGGYYQTSTVEECGKNLRDVDGKTFTGTATVGSVTVTCYITYTCY